MFLLLARGVLAQPTGFSNLHLQSPQVTATSSSVGVSRASALGSSSAPQDRAILASARCRVVSTCSGSTEPPSRHRESHARVRRRVRRGGRGGGWRHRGGAPFDDTVAVNAGAAYVFDGTTGALLHTLLVAPAPGRTPVRPRASRRSAATCSSCAAASTVSTAARARWCSTTPRPAASGGRGLATIAGDVLSAGYDGTICRFDGATGAVVQTYVDPEPGLGGPFGSSIGVDGNVVVVGGEVFSGARESVYVFDGTTGVLVQTIRGPYYGTPYNAGFGTAVAAAGGVLVGSGWNSARFYDGVSYAFLGEVGPEEFRRGRVARHRHRCLRHELRASGRTRSAERRPRVDHLLDPCGNGILSPAEQCDDGNTTSGDGCSATCRLERVRRRSPWHVIRSIPRAPPQFPAEARRGAWAQTVTVRVEVEGCFVPWPTSAIRRSMLDLPAVLLRRSLRDTRSDDRPGDPRGRSLRDGKPCWKAKGTQRLRLQGSGSDAQRNRDGHDPREGRLRRRIAVSGRGGRLALPGHGRARHLPLQFRLVGRDGGR